MEKPPQKEYKPKKASDFDPESEILKILTIGDYGTGKSGFGTTFPDPKFVFDFDKGISLYRNVSDCDYEQFDTSAQGWIHFDKVFKWVQKAVSAGKYKSVIWDSGTTAGDTVMERALSLNPQRDETGGPIWNVHYSLAKNLMAPKIRQFKDLNCNVLLISHWKHKIDSKTGNILGADAMFVGDLSGKAPGFFDEVYCSFTKTLPGGKTFYGLRLVSRQYYKARSRLSGMDNLMPNELPNNYAAVMEAFKKGVNKKND